jgi:hypothetical protein
MVAEMLAPASETLKNIGGGTFVIKLNPANCEARSYKSSGCAPADHVALREIIY